MSTAIYKSNNINNYKNNTCKKWQCVTDENEGYDKPIVICCSKCNHFSAYLYKMHLDDDDIGSYYCDCGKDVELYYLCFKCKQSKIIDYY